MAKAAVVSEGFGVADSSDWLAWAYGGGMTQKGWKLTLLIKSGARSGPPFRHSSFEFGQYCVGQLRTRPRTRAPFNGIRPNGRCYYGGWGRRIAARRNSGSGPNRANSGFDGAICGKWGQGNSITRWAKANRQRIRIMRSPLFQCRTAPTSVPPGTSTSTSRIRLQTSPAVDGRSGPARQAAITGSTFR